MLIATCCRHLDVDIDQARGLDVMLLSRPHLNRSTATRTLTHLPVQTF
jgi:hypothetical protein